MHAPLRARAGARMHVNQAFIESERAKEGEVSHVVCGRVTVGCADRGAARIWVLLVVDVMRIIGRQVRAWEPLSNRIGS